MPRMGKRTVRGERMKDAEKVLDGLKHCYDGVNCTRCPYMQYIYHCRRHLMQDAIAVIEALLKEKEVTS